MKEEHPVMASTNLELGEELGDLLAKLGPPVEQTAREMIVLELCRPSLISSGKAADWQRGAGVCPDAPTRNH